jgi:DNA-binding NarL/FixJ family response regulator
MGAGFSRRRKMRVFIADDSRVVVERLADLLNEVPGVQLVGRANDAPEAIQSIVKTNPDAVILDLQMPGGSGLDVLRCIRQTHPSVWVLICTNYPYPQYREECIAAGADYFLDKSAEFEKIPEILRDLTKKAPNVTPAAR